MVDIGGKRSNQIVRQALAVLANLTHRGARGAEPNTGDGAGILIQVPHAFLRRKADRHGYSLPGPGHYGVGMVFLPPDVNHRRAIEIHFEKIVASEGQRVLGWRTVKVNNGALGKTARRAEPKMRMIFVARNPAIADDLAFERRLYVIRKRAENEIRYGGSLEGGEFFYVASLSHRTLIYKGMFVSDQLEGYFRDLAEPDLETSLALVHSRFSTNTFPSWELPIPTGMSSTTVRSTPCAATSTGCARRSTCSNPTSSAATSRRSCPSCSPMAATRPCSTTASSSCS